MDVASLASCAELTTEHVDIACRSSMGMRDLLAWASRVAKPGEGAPKILMAIARLARADWVEGSAFVEITGSEDDTAISIFADHGMGIRERVLPLTRLRVPVDEFVRAVRLAPQLVAPFRAIQKSPDCLRLTPHEVTETDSEKISIDESSLHEQARRTAPPKTPVKEGEPVISGAPNASNDGERKSGVPDLAITTPPPSDQSGIHTHPTVRRMVAVRPEALRSGNDDE